MTMAPTRLVLWAGLLPVLAVNLAYLINVTSGADLCFPYLEGCQSVSRGLRSGPGLWLFKLLALPCAVFMMLAWRETPDAVDRVIPDGRPLSAAVVGFRFLLNGLTYRRQSLQGAHHIGVLLQESPAAQTRSTLSGRQ